MTNTLTHDVDATVDQCIRIIKAGADYVRITVPSVDHAENLIVIRERLRSKGYPTPLIADVHFNTAIAMKAASVVEKVRINPGNFGLSGKFHKNGYTAEEFREEWEKQRKTFADFLGVCKKHGTAVRIGVNHGSLSDRIMSRYGNTPEGMAESTLEFLRICRDEKFSSVVVSIKASNTLVMIYATRMLVKRMEQENMPFPLHLGVTEAGEGEDGRIKSAIGIGTLLAEGIGDTIRVSLTEEPEAEIPVAQKLVKLCSSLMKNGSSAAAFPYYSLAYARRKSSPVGNMGGSHVPVVVTTGWMDIAEHDRVMSGANSKPWKSEQISPDYVFVPKWRDDCIIPAGKRIILPFAVWLKQKDNGNFYPLFTGDEIRKTSRFSDRINFLQLGPSELSNDMVDIIRNREHLVIVAVTGSRHAFTGYRQLFSVLARNKIAVPVILKGSFNETEKEDFQMKASVHLGGLLVDGVGDGIWLEGSGLDDQRVCCFTAFAILQAARARISKTEYIACPSCGRTHFNLMETLAAIKAKTAHLKGLKIGVMGCIVNGPGEMADADYGYVGSGRGKITLYKAREVVKRNIPESCALEELIKVIKENGDWREENRET